MFETQKSGNETSSGEIHGLNIRTPCKSQSEVLAFVVNAGTNVASDNFFIQNKERSFFGLSICFDQLKLDQRVSGICFSISGWSMMNISSRYREVSLNMSIR